MRSYYFLLIASEYIGTTKGGFTSPRKTEIQDANNAVIGLVRQWALQLHYGLVF